MRNGILLDENTVMTIDNTGCVGEKDLDTVFAPNSIVAAFCMRVSVLEQWCAGAKPHQILLSNFTGDTAWEDYIDGFQSVFNEIGEPLPHVAGSTESNFDSLQSGISVTVIGKKLYTISHENVDYFIVGEPFVGKQVLENPERVAKLHELYEGLKLGVIKAIWPCGSKGIQHEIERFTGHVDVTYELDGSRSAGPSTAVLVAVDKERLNAFQQLISTPIMKIK